MDASDRPEPPEVADERATLTGFLDYQRATLAWKISDLGADDLRRRAVPSSALSLLGLVRHMAEVERGWFRKDLAGESIGDIWTTEDTPEAAFDVEGADVDEAIVAWEAECDQARAIAAAYSLDETFVLRGSWTLSLRWLLSHMVEEYARHNGHADLLREAIDGEVGE
jgi:uncharacterized damage-inducible protein DinB